MELDVDALREVLGAMETHEPTGLRFQIACTGCGQFVWVSEGKVGSQVTCEHCSVVNVVTHPDSTSNAASSLELIAAGTAANPGPYDKLKDLGLGPGSSFTDVLLAYDDGDDEAEALRELRDPARRFARDLLCYPNWRSKDVSAHEPA